MGKYINLIGPDGSGKDTIFAKLVKLYPHAIKVMEPGGTSETDLIRMILLDLSLTRCQILEILTDLLKCTNLFEITKRYLQYAYIEIEKNGLSAYAEAYLFAASRSQTLREIVQPALQKGKLVLGRRSFACSMAYQGYARDIGMDKVWNVNQDAIKGIYPDLEIYLDISIDVMTQRISDRTEKQDRLDLESIGFYKKVIKGYHIYYEEYCPYSYSRVDATKSIDEVFYDVLSIIHSMMEEQQ